MFHAWKNNQAFPVFLIALTGSRWVFFSKLLPGPGKSSTEVKATHNLMPVLVTAYFCKPQSQIPFSLGTPSSKFINIKPWLNSAWKSMNLGAPYGLMPALCCATAISVLKGQVREEWRKFSCWCCLDEGSWNKGTVNSSCHTSLVLSPKALPEI